jgi:hypothetical protein
MFSYLSAEERVRKDPSAAGHDGRDFAGDVGGMYSKRGRPSIPPKKIVAGAVAADAPFSALAEAADGGDRLQHAVFRWFVGLNLDEEMCDATNEFLLRVGKRARD